MTGRRRLHPERVFMVLILVSGLTTYALFGIGFFLDQPNIYRWAWSALAITLLIGFIPLVAALIGVAIDKLRGDRDHD
jgi:hypothetical protein